MKIAPTRSDLNQIYVTAWDAANNYSTALYQFWVTEGAPPTAYWKLNKAAGTSQLADSADHTEGQMPHPASVVGGATLGAPGRSCTSIQFDGTDGRASTNEAVIDTGKSFAVSAWAKVTDPNRNSTFVRQDASSASGFYLQYRAKPSTNRRGGRSRGSRPIPATRDGSPPNRRAPI